MNAPLSPQAAAQRRAQAGLFYGLAAYGLWGIMPIYFKWLQAVPSIDIVAHRIVWSLLVLVLLVTAVRAWDQIGDALRSRKALAMLFVIGGRYLSFATIFGPVRTGMPRVTFTASEDAEAGVSLPRATTLAVSTASL